MGQLIYGSGTSYELEDRTLAHVRLAAGAKLRRQESFYLSWSVSDDPLMGRVSVWLSPSTPLQIHFLGNTAPAINPVWIRALELSAVGDRGMIVMAESEAEDFVLHHPPVG